MHHVDYWESHNLPVFNLFSQNVTFFSEESGEIAISILAQSLPTNHSGDLKDTQRYCHITALMWSCSKWKEAKLRGHEAKLFETDLKLGQKTKKHRILRKTNLYSLLAAVLL